MTDAGIHTGPPGWRGRIGAVAPAARTGESDPLRDLPDGEILEGAGLANAEDGQDRPVGALPGDQAADVDEVLDDWPSSDPAPSALFDGDTGTLEDKQRRAFVALLKHKFISSATHAAEWKIVRDNQELFRSRLNDMFLELHLNERYEVAFKRRVVGDGVRDFPALLQDLAWTREETLILVYLRNRHRVDQMSGRDDVTVEREEIDDYVKRFRPVHATDRAADETRFRKAVENLITAKVLQKTNDAERLRISPVLPVLLPLERLKDLHEWLAARNAGPDAGGGGTEHVEGLESADEAVRDGDMEQTEEVSA